MISKVQIHFPFTSRTQYFSHLQIERIFLDLPLKWLFFVCASLGNDFPKIAFQKHHLRTEDEVKCFGAIWWVGKNIGIVHTYMAKMLKLHS